jgi:hypothetical protein
MNKSQNINMENKRMQGNMTIQNVNNRTIQDLMDSEGDESSAAEIRRMITRMFRA